MSVAKPGKEITVMGAKRVALVTGASKGIGEGIARYLQKAGYFVHCTYRSGKEQIEKSFGGTPNMTIHHLDVGNEAQVQKVMADILGTSGGLHLLVNNAAVDFLTSIEAMTLHQWDETFNARCRGTFLIQQQFPERKLVGWSCLPVASVVRAFSGCHIL